MAHSTSFAACFPWTTSVAPLARAFWVVPSDSGLGIVYPSEELLQKLEECYRYQPVKGSGTKEGIAYYMMRVVLAVELFMALAVFLILLTNYGAPVPPAAGS